MPNFKLSIRKLSRLSLLILVAGAVALLSSKGAVAQGRNEPSVGSAEVSQRKTSTGAVVTLSADVPLARAQTWQDSEGYHVILPSTPLKSVRHAPRGIRTRQVGRSLELVVPVTPESDVTLEPHSNSLSIIVNGGMSPAESDEDRNAPAHSARVSNHGQQETSQSARLPRASRTQSASSTLSSSQSGDRASSTGSAEASREQRDWSSPVPVKASVLPVGKQPPGDAKPPVSTPAQAAQATDVHNAQTATQAAVPAPAQSVNLEATKLASPQDVNQNNKGFFGAIFSSTAVLVFLGLLTVVLLVMRRRSAGASEPEDEHKSLVGDTRLAQTGNRVRGDDRRKTGREAVMSQSRALVLSGQHGEPEHGASEKRAVPAVSAPAILFGPYRVDQEVGKLLLGQPHRMDVLASRAPDDRRAIENSLMKPLSSRDSSEESRRRARRALEEYGFVARQSASLLMARNAYERVTAASALGEIGSEMALPFMLEALYDPEQVVRTQAVLSLGALKMPAAIGAILDLARRHPDMPSAVLSDALNACSFEMVESDGIFTSKQIEVSGTASWTGEITRLDPAARFEDLPEWLEDENLADALERLANTDPEARIAAARALAAFPVQRAVSALSAMAAQDPEASVRSTAIASLGAIDHESVFAPVLVALADESREVSAAAARALNRLNFDRADAYVRIMETSEPDTLRSVARSCIKAGIARQGIERLASEDRRSAYEAFSLLSLLAKSNETEPILDAIVNHPSLDVRLSAVHLLSLSGQPEVVQQLRLLSVHDGLPGSLRTSLLEVVYKIDQNQPV